MGNDQRLGPGFMLSSGPRWRREGGYEVAPEFGLKLVARAGLVKASGGRMPRFDLAAVAPILAVALVTVSCSVLPAGPGGPGGQGPGVAAGTGAWLGSTATTASGVMPSARGLSLTR